MIVSVLIPIFGMGVKPVLAACGGDPPLPPEGLSWPVAGAIANSWTLDCVSDRGHRGIDISTAADAEIAATASGTVSFAGYTPAEGGGLTLAITHEGGLRSTYLHLATLFVSAGQRVSAGQVIGAGDGTPLHFGLKLTGGRETYFNPLEHLPSDTQPPPGAPSSDDAMPLGSVVEAEAAAGAVIEASAAQVAPVQQPLGDPLRTGDRLPVTAPAAEPLYKAASGASSSPALLSAPPATADMDSRHGGPVSALPAVSTMIERADIGLAVGRTGDAINSGIQASAGGALISSNRESGDFPQKRIAAWDKPAIKPFSLVPVAVMLLAVIMPGCIFRGRGGGSNPPLAA